MFAKLAKALVAELPLPLFAGGFLIFTIAGEDTCSEVVRRLLMIMFVMPSEIDCAGDGDDDLTGLEAIRLWSSCLPSMLRRAPPEEGGEVDVVLTGVSDERAVVAVALDVDPAAAFFAKGARRPPLNENRDDELALDPGRRGDGKLGECEAFATFVGEAGGGPPLPTPAGDGVLLREGNGGVAGIVSSGVCISAAVAEAKSFDSEEGPAEAELDRLRTGNRCEFGDLVGPRGSVAEEPDWESSGSGGLIGRSKGGELDRIS